MDTSAHEAALRKKLQHFLVELLRFGTVQGFQHFSMYLRGKEELSVTVYHEPQVSSRRCSFIGNLATEISAGDSLTSAHLPYDQRALMLSQGTQMVLSGMGSHSVGLPPASPSDNEERSNSDSHTLFLIAGYARYSCPYVWVRSNHSRLLKMSGFTDKDKDNPLRLKSTSQWKDTEVFIWDVIAELVKLCMYPAPRNPFAVNMDYLSSLPLQQQVLATAAVISCLERIFVHTPEDKYYSEKVMEDLQLASRLHYSALQTLAQKHQLPVLEESRQREQTQKMQTAQIRRGTFAKAGNRYPSTENSLFPPSTDMTVESTQGIYTPQGSAKTGFPGYGFTPAPSLF